MTDEPPPKPSPAVDCMHCRSFFVTYEPGLPYGCRTFAFKSRSLPAQVVLANSGEPCRAYEARSRPQKS